MGRGRSTNRLDADFTVRTVVSFWGSTNKFDLFEGVDGVDPYDADDPELFLAHGTADWKASAPYSESELFQSIYDDVGMYSELVPLDGEGRGVRDAEVDGKGLSEMSFDVLVAQQRLIVWGSESTVAFGSGPRPTSPVWSTADTVGWPRSVGPRPHRAVALALPGGPMPRCLLLVPLLVACGPSEEERQVAADSALTAMGITEATLSGEQGAYSFNGQRHGYPCEGRVSVEDPAAPKVEPGVCAPPDGTAELALYDHASRIFHTENLALTGVGGDEVKLTATRKGDACTGTATRQPWGMLDAELKCGAMTLTAHCLKADRPATEAEQHALLTHIRPAVEAHGLSEVALEQFGCFPSFSGVKRGEPCHGKVKALANADGEVELELDEARCPGALPPPEALVDPGAFLAWYLVEKQGHEAPRVTASGGGWCLATTLEGKRYVGGAALQGGRIEATVGHGGSSRFFKVPVPEQARQGRPDGTAPTGCTD